MLSVTVVKNRQSNAKKKSKIVDFGTLNEVIENGLHQMRKKLKKVGKHFW